MTAGLVLPRVSPLILAQTLFSLSACCSVASWWLLGLFTGRVSRAVFEIIDTKPGVSKVFPLIISVGGTRSFSKFKPIKLVKFTFFSPQMIALVSPQPGQVF